MEKNGENWPDDIPGNCYTISVAQFRVEVLLVTNKVSFVEKACSHLPLSIVLLQ